MKILVTGATGNIGRKVVDQLLARGADDVRALTNDPGKAALPAEVEVAHGYLRRLDTLPQAFVGVECLYLAPTPDTVGEVLEIAREAGVRRVVDLSGEPESWWGSVCGAVEASGIAWTHLWPGDFMENTLVWKRQIQETGAVREPYPETASAPIAMDDIASVAAEALLDDSHVGKAHWLAGPQVLTRAELAHTIGAALGRDVPFLTVSPVEAVQVLQPTMGETAEWYVNTVLAGFVENPDVPTRSVEQITGRPAVTFAQWAAANVTAFDGSAAR
ncbi:hydroxylase [Nocardia donostiensis]|uniref:NAD(P)H-binding protein n=1 Tax=Nocardia donostiensis TaxID=1538463 RepID=UPI0009DAE8EE|nr:NAD(P)H-binding protein [Nocardia donostiensis]OQS14926.1 hydroxylase [Nocardia donostiensis]